MNILCDTVVSSFFIQILRLIFQLLALVKASTVWIHKGGSSGREFPFQISTSHQCNPNKVSHASSVAQVYQMRMELPYIFDACFNSYSRLICFQSLIEVLV